MTDIVCIGCALADIMIEGLSVKDKQMNVEFEGRFRYVDSIRVMLGGDALNEAIVLARLGKSVSLICGLGRDLVGEMIYLQAQKAGVSMENVVWEPASKSQVNALLIQEDKEKYYFAEPMSKSMYFIPPEDGLRGAKIVTLASLFSAPFDQKDVIYKTIRSAKNSGAVVCADVILTPSTTLTLNCLRDSLAMLDYFFPNEEEAGLLTGKETVEEMGEVLKNFGIKNVIIKLGARGCYIKTEHKEGYVEAFRGRMIDSTGAGDCFLAGFAAALSENKPIEECCRFASAAALLAVESVGATAGVTGREAVERILKENAIL